MLRVRPSESMAICIGCHSVLRSTKTHWGSAGWEDTVNMGVSALVVAQHLWRQAARPPILRLHEHPAGSGRVPREADGLGAVGKLAPL